MTPEELNKACEWLEEHWGDYYAPVEYRKLTDDFRKAMDAVIKESLTTAENNAESRFIDKGCEWLDNTLPDIEYITNASALRQNKKQFIDTFRKAMGAVVKESLTTNLTWEDIRRIVGIAGQMIQTAHDRVEWEDKSEEAYYTEVLRRFKED